VHGNGPQVGRLLQSDPERGNLDIHIAQTQGELGYLLADATAGPMACLLTRVIVDDDQGRPVKPIGPILAAQPDDGSAVCSGAGWRVIVPSPRPTRVVEQEAIATLLRTHHVIAGGGGGVPITAQGAGVSGVVDKDWVASLLAIQLDAQNLVFATDVDGVYQDVEQPDLGPVPYLSITVAGEMIESGGVTAGSMAPKLASAVEFVETTGQPARICHLDQIEAAISGSAGTTVEREPR
jgi:carbamate kinase